MSRKIRWAVLLCKCRGVADNNDIKQFFVNFFTNGSDGAIDYWRDVSFMELDLHESSVFGWFELPFTSNEMLTVRRSDSIQKAIDTAIQANSHIGEYGPKLVFISEPLIGQNVTTGAAQGGPGTVGGNMSADLSHLRASFILHEMGHVHGLPDSLFLNGQLYGSPYCLMSAEIYGNTDPRFTDQFVLNGPGLCAAYTYKAGWLPEGNIIRIQSNGKHPGTTICTLAAFQFRNIARKQVAIIEFNTPQLLSYFIEYRRAEAWDRGLTQDAVVLHQLRSDGFAYYAGDIKTSVGFTGAAVLLPGKVYVDPQFDLSVEVISILNDDGTVEIRIAPAMAVQTLSVRKIAREKLGLTTGFSIKNEILQNRTINLRDRLIEILGH